VRWYREIALFVPWFIAQVRILLPSGTPGCLNGVDVVKDTMLILIKPGVIKDEKLHFGTPVAGISDACGDAKSYSGADTSGGRSLLSG
jgi:hypothetical protein